MITDCLKSERIGDISVYLKSNSTDFKIIELHHKNGGFPRCVVLQAKQGFYDDLVDRHEGKLHEYREKFIDFIRYNHLDIELTSELMVRYEETKDLIIKVDSVYGASGSLWIDKFLYTQAGKLWFNEHEKAKIKYNLKDDLVDITNTLNN